MVVSPSMVNRCRMSSAIVKGVERRDALFSWCVTRTTLHPSRFDGSSQPGLSGEPSGAVISSDVFPVWTLVDQNEGMTKLRVSPSASSVRDAQKRFDRKVDRALAEEQLVGTPIFCRAGCSLCCDMPIIATYLEAEAALTAATPEMLDQHRVRARQVTDLAHAVGREEEFLSSYRSVASFCPFLVEGLCGIYAARPGKCRSTYSTRDASFCADGGILAMAPEAVDQYVRENESNPRVEGFTHYLVSTETPITSYQQELMAEAKRRHGAIVYGDWSVMVALAADDSFRQNLGTAGRSAQRVSAAVSAHPLYHPWVLRIA